MADHQVLQSVGSTGDAYDNALAESFVDSFKVELIKDRVWQTRSQLELAIVEYLGWFDNARLHESLGDMPPAEFELLHEDKSAIASLRSTSGLAALPAGNEIDNSLIDQLRPTFATVEPGPAHCVSYATVPHTVAHGLRNDESPLRERAS